MYNLTTRSSFSLTTKANNLFSTKHWQSSKLIFLSSLESPPRQPQPLLRLIKFCVRNTTNKKLSYQNYQPKKLLNNFIFKMNTEEKPKVVFVLGAPGAGKGTQCSFIVEKFGYVHISAGDLLREERQRKGSEYGELIENCIVSGKIVPATITCSLIENAINKQLKAHGKNKFLIDGFPRNEDNLTGWNKQMIDKCNLQFVLVFDCSENVCTDRCINRGEGGSGRSDDNKDSLVKRFNTFYNDSMPIIEHYESKDLVFHINGDRSPSQVFEKVEKLFTEKNNGNNE